MTAGTFLRRFMRSPKTIGAVLPSSRFLAEQMVEQIDFDTVRSVVEYGPGTGVFTDALLERRTADTVLLLIEADSALAEGLREKYADERNLIIVNDSAERIDEVLAENRISHVDTVVSGLPFTSLPSDVSDVILKKTAALIGTEGSFHTFQYSLYKKAFFDQFFADIMLVKELRNLPPAYVLHCRNRT